MGVSKRIVILKMRWHLRVETGHVHHRARVEDAGRGQRERRPQAQMHAHAWGMQVASLTVIESVRAAGSRGVIAWRLVRERAESKRPRVEEGGSKAPRIILGPRSRIEVFDAVVACAWMGLSRAESMLASAREILPRRPCHGADVEFEE